MLGRSFVKTGVISFSRNLFAVLFVTFDRAKSEPKGEGCIWVGAGSFECELDLGDFCIGLSFGFFDFEFHAFADFAGFSIHCKSK